MLPVSLALCAPGWGLGVGASPQHAGYGGEGTKGANCGPRLLSLPSWTAGAQAQPPCKPPAACKRATARQPPQCISHHSAAATTMQVPSCMRVSTSASATTEHQPPQCRPPAACKGAMAWHLADRSAEQQHGNLPTEVCMYEPAQAQPRRYPSVEYKGAGA
eukprot:1139688-Pelagomonas_calceolata.AAC.1